MDKSYLFKKIDQAFLPAREIEIPELFSGRKAEIVRGLYALRSDGASLCIYGRRGVGKTSVAKQLRLVAAGYPTLTDIIKRPELFSKDIFNLPTIYFCCDDTIQNANDLFRKLLSDRDSMHGICQYNDGIILQKTKTKNTKSAKLTLKIFDIGETEEQETENIVSELDSVSAFKSVTSEIADATNAHSLVVVIDEFERVANKIGIASIIRTCPYVKFILVGVSDDIRELINDHESIKRQLAEGTIKIDPMTDKMLVEILKRSEAIIKELRFNDEVMASIISLASGYPHWVHLIGKLSCIDAVEKGKSIIEMSNFKNAIEKIVKYEPTYNDLYVKAASSSRDEEMLLKLLAIDKGEEQNISEISQKARNFGINSVLFQRCIDFLIDLKILNSVRPGFTIFEDIRFKVFITIRSPLFSENTKAKLLKKQEINYLSKKIRSWAFFDYDEPYLMDINNSYATVSHMVPITVNFENNWAIVESEDKPLLYDGKGNPIYKKKY